MRHCTKDRASKEEGVDYFIANAKKFVFVYISYYYLETSLLGLCA